MRNQVHAHPPGQVGEVLEDIVAITAVAETTAAGDAEATHQGLEIKTHKAEEAEEADMVAAGAKAVEGVRWAAVSIIRAWMIWDRSLSRGITEGCSMKISRAYLLLTRNDKRRIRDISKTISTIEGIKTVVVVVEVIEEVVEIEVEVVIVVVVDMLVESESEEDKEAEWVAVMLVTTTEHIHASS